MAYIMMFVSCPICGTTTAEYSGQHKSGFPLYSCDIGHERLIFVRHGKQRSFDKNNWEIYLRIITKTETKKDFTFSEVLGGRKP